MEGGSNIELGEPGLPSGQVVFVFTDIEASTMMLKAVGEIQADSLFATHEAILAEVWADHGGTVISMEGDSFFVAFTSVTAAIGACVEGQRRLTGHDWPMAGRLRVRMGVHAGLAVPRRGTYVALAVHQANRVMAAAHGDQILVSQFAYSQFGEESDPAGGRRSELFGAAISPLGKFRVRDFDDPIDLYRIDWSDEFLNETAIRAVPASRHNIIPARNSFIGRQPEMVAVNGLIDHGEVVTLVGPGGVGKTRLITETAVQIADSWRDGVWFIDLAEVLDARLVPDAIAQTIGVATTGQQSLWEAVVDHLRDHEALVVLDTIEHLVDECRRRVADLVSRCPGVAVVSTGREPLQCLDEVVFRVQPLASNGRTPSANSAAVRLFVERARQAQPGIDPTPDDLEIIGQICVALDGLPLAIEIAAAQIPFMQLPEILTSLNSRLNQLRSRDRSLPSRQRNMNDLIGWSYRLLSATERQAFRRLALFSSDFGIEAASVAVADIADGSHDSTEPTAPAEAREIVWSLVNKSLLGVDISEAQTRYRYADTVREFALALALDNDDLTTEAGRLAGWYLRWLGPQVVHGRRWVGDAGVELANLRGLAELLAESDQEVAQQLVWVIARHHDQTNNFKGGINESEAAIARLSQPTPTLVALLSDLAEMYLRINDTGRATELTDRAARIQDDVGSPGWDRAAVTRTRSGIALRNESLAEAEQVALGALDGTLTLANESRLWSRVGIARYGQADLEGAQEAFARELDCGIRSGENSSLAGSRANLAEVALQIGDVESACEHQLACLADALEFGQPILVAYSLVVGARLAAAAKRWPDAGRLLAAAEAIFERANYEVFDSDRIAIVELRGRVDGALGAEPTEAGGPTADAMGLVEAVDLVREVLAAAPTSVRKVDLLEISGSESESEYKQCQ